MRTRWLVSAALAAAVTMIVGCSRDPGDIVNNNTLINNSPKSGTLVGTHVDTLPGNCQRTVDILTTGIVNGGVAQMTPGENRDFVVDERFSRAGCGTPQAFRWTSSNQNVATVTSVDSITGRVHAIAPPTTQICAIGMRDGVTACTTVSVGTPSTNQVSIAPTNVTLSSGAGCSVFSQQFTATTIPAGLAVTWSKLTSHVTGATLSSTGLYAFGAGVAGTDTVRASLATGETATAVITISAAACSNPCTVTAFSASTPKSVIVVGENVTLNASQTTTGTGCPPLTFASSNNAVATVDATGVVHGVSPGQVVIRVTAANGQFIDISMTVNAPTPTASFVITPSSVCLSTAASGPASVNVQVVISGVTNPTVTATRSSSNFTVTAVGSNVGNTTNWTISGPVATNANDQVNFTVAGANGTGNLPVQITTGACPGTGGNTIDYTPPGGTVTTTTPTATLTAVCKTNGVVVACPTSPSPPFWTSDHPELIDVAGNGSTVVQGFTYKTGNTATVTRIAPTNGVIVQICVQQSLSQTTPRQCYSWTAP